MTVAILSWIFSTLLYPIVVMALFGGLGAGAVAQVATARNVETRFRVGVAVATPVVALVFLVSLVGTNSDVFEAVISPMHPTMLLGTGAVGGWGMLHLLKWVSESGLGFAQGLLGLTLSSLFSGLLWATMSGGLALLDWVMLGFVLGTGGHIVALGAPWRSAG